HHAHRRPRADGPPLPEGSRPVDPGVVVEHKHLDGVFAFIAAQQQQRDAARLASPKLTRREKDRLHAGSALRTPAPLPGSGHLYLGQERTFLLCVDTPPATPRRTLPPFPIPTSLSG